MTKVGRNDPCPCGSGNKFKKCCEKPKARKILTASVLSSGSVGKMASLFKHNIQKEEKKEGDSSLSEKVSSPNLS